jgi:entericidin A
LESKVDSDTAKKDPKKIHRAIFFGNLSHIWLVSLSSSDHRPPAALLSNIGPARISLPPLESVPGHFASHPERFEKMTSFRAIILAILASVVVTGCNTVKGAGRDIESVGQAGADAID